ncbi:GNAT family N-acetyltransferase [Pseudomonas oryzihabitans]|uniref:GNAT family N-acetyltransferase n=1 Tax=Pseudomonas oryzihabitans TaxID=47885 RepID=UPI000EE7B6EF|nr:GNAT family protein [Pseudomonas oryzihabitans]HCV77197.1 GNAT family N-acetyltransferase [Pseudomonas sp.]
MTPLDWTPARLPQLRLLQGQHVRLEPLDPPRHGEDLWEALHDRDPALWDYLPYGPFTERAAFDSWLAGLAGGRDPLFYAVVDPRQGRALGQLSLMSIVPEHGSIEIGHVAFGGRLQRTPLATEAFYLLMQEAFALGYRRLEWKCDNSNARSKRAAERLGMRPEGLFRQHRVVKGRNRDTAWFSLLDHEWPAVDAGFRRWLAAENFDAEGRQLSALAVSAGRTG